jgi:hypothetical protein
VGFFDRSDCHDFYTLKSPRVGGFGVKIILLKLIYKGSFRAEKFLTRMHCIILKTIFFVLPHKNFCVCSF